MTVQDSCQSANKVESGDILHAENVYISQFVVAKMDCPSEEHLIRMALEDLEPGVALEFDTPNRKLKVFHNGNLEAIQSRVESLGLGAKLESTSNIDRSELSQAIASANTANLKEGAILKWLLAINATMFVVELFVGWSAQSTGLIADSLDMFADAAVYGVALYAVGYSAQRKLRAAHLSGWMQVVLALGALSEVLRRFIFGSEPVSILMMTFGIIALIANVTCLILIAKSKDDGAHMKASWIFSANDVIANVGVILAGVLVAVTGSRYPDLVIGLMIAVIVFIGAQRILKLRS
jgi:cation transport ATPase|tara:strand:+ start:925 stop:1806 length:882 start_codon:yes stop_codon:yes gene_type:complete